MPLGTQMPDEKQFVKLLLIGNSKVGKTHYAVQAAEAGFKVLYIDGDVSRPTIRQASEAALGRLMYLPFGDMIDINGLYIPRFSLLFKRFLSKGKFLWDDEMNRMADDSSVGHRVVEFSPALLHNEWVIVIDSWTSMSHSIMNAIAMNAGIDLSDMDKAGQAIYGSANNFATDLLQRIRTLNCHVIVIAHPDEYVKYRVKPGNLKDSMRTENREIESSRMIPKSISRNHGVTLASYFTDVAWLEIDAMDRRIINFETTASKEGGGRFSGKYKVDECSFATLVDRAGGQVPDSVSMDNDPAMTIIPTYVLPDKPMTPTVMSPQGGGTNAGKVTLGAKPLNLGKGK